MFPSLFNGRTRPLGRHRELEEEIAISGGGLEEEIAINGRDGIAETASREAEGRTLGRCVCFDEAAKNPPIAISKGAGRGGQVDASSELAVAITPTLWEAWEPRLKRLPRVAIVRVAIVSDVLA